MRRWSLSTLRYRIEFAPGVREQLTSYSDADRGQLESRIEEMAELAALVPIPSVGGITDERWGPPLRMDVGELEIAYRLRRRDAVLEVLAISAI